MRLTIIIDGLPYRCDTANPRILAAWITDLMSTIRMNPATLIELKSDPLGQPYVNGFPGYPWSLDWLADSRIIGQVRRIAQPTPRAVLEELSHMVEEAERMKNG